MFRFGFLTKCQNTTIILLRNLTDHIRGFKPLTLSTLGILWCLVFYIKSVSNVDILNINANLCSIRRTRVGTLIVATIYLQLLQTRYMFRSFTVLQCSHQHYVQPVASDVEVVGYL